MTSQTACDRVKSIKKEGEMTVPKVFLSGYAKLPDNTTAQKLYNHLVLVVTA